MSKFAEKLRRTYTGSTPSMGFRKSAETELPPLLLIANLTKANVTEAKVLAGEVDAAIVNSGDINAKSFGQLAKASGDIPLGIFLESDAKSETVKSFELGSDFVVFGLRTPLEAVNKEGPGKILKIDPSLDQGLARAINALPLQVDGVLVNGEESLITIERLLIYRRFAELLDKPLLITLGSSVTSDELKSLYEAGVNGLMLSEGFPVEAFAELKKTIAGLSKTAKRRIKGTALLPRLGGQLEAETEEEEEEEV
ncbi:MAG: hypothetical protein FJ006_06170 [Chloroflexi bacterium]|nr:hypothetical protein [Chloroflexota bacterium]MBM3174392.1 hypothetical protein [Chloroflexota bacterium]